MESRSDNQKNYYEIVVLVVFYYYDVVYLLMIGIYDGYNTLNR